MGEFPNKATQFKPGQSGNPKGMPKGIRSFKSVLQEYLQKEIKVTDPIDNVKKSVPIRSVISLKLIAQAIKGDKKAIQEVIDRVDGKPMQQIETENTQRVVMDNIIINGKELKFDIGDDEPNSEASESTGEAPASSN